MKDSSHWSEVKVLIFHKNNSDNFKALEWLCENEKDVFMLRDGA